MNIKHFSVFCFNRYFCLHFCLNKIESLTSRLAHMVYLFKIVPKNASQSVYCSYQEVSLVLC